MRPYEPERIARVPDAAAARQPRLRPALFVLLDPHLLPHCARQGRARAQAGRRSSRRCYMLTDSTACAIFLFQDDDFPLVGHERAPLGRRARRADCTTAGSRRRRIWKISCRAEYVEPELFARMRDAGLFLVYMGIESGGRGGPGGRCYKQMTVEQNLDAVATLKRLGIVFAYGFMLFDPSSTFELDPPEHRVPAHRSSATAARRRVFCRMLPYGGTPIRDQLAKEGRLRGDSRIPDYDFLDPRINEYHRLLTRRCVRGSTRRVCPIRSATPSTSWRRSTAWRPRRAAARHTGWPCATDGGLQQQAVRPGRGIVDRLRAAGDWSALEPQGPCATIANAC